MPASAWSDDEPQAPSTSIEATNAVAAERRREGEEQLDMGVLQG